MCKELIEAGVKGLHLYTLNREDCILKILGELKSKNLRIRDLSTKESDLEDVFISLTQKR